MPDDQPHPRQTILLLATALTALLFAGAQSLFCDLIGIAPTKKDLALFPAWTVFYGIAATSGILVAARLFNVMPAKSASVVAMAFAALSMVAFHYFEYLRWIRPDWSRAGDIGNFAHFVNLEIRHADIELNIGHAHHPTVSEIGLTSYVFLSFELIGYLLGGLLTITAIEMLPRCTACGLFLRKIIKKKLPEMPLDSAKELGLLLKAGDITRLDRLLSQPSESPYTTVPRARIKLKLYECPSCRRQSLRSSVEAFEEKEWKSIPELKSLSLLPDGVSLEQALRQQ